ncbi:MAG: PIG-L family deacetylase [Flavobacteriaceae bacterium]
MHKKLVLFTLTLSFFFSLSAQNSGSIYRQLEKLNFLGSMLYVAAHPDDENTALISHFSNHVHAHSAYLSLTRGDGGQNLIGTELREMLGVIRTNELIQARKIDSGNQFFSSAIDFGYSKHPKETLKIWDKTQILGEVVQRIRSFQPDIIIHRFDHRTPGRTHGHHTSSALLSHQAFSLTNDPNSYPEQLTNLKPWQVRRQFFNTSWWFYGSRERFEKADKINLLALEIGNYDALKGISNSEIAAASRSSHKSQGFGSSSSLGARTEYIELVNGDRPASNDPFEGINTTWTRLEGGEKIGKLVAQALVEFDFKAPQKSVPLLIDIHQAIEGLSPSVWKNRKLKAVKALIKSCAGLTLQLNSDSAYGIAGENLKINFNSVHQSEQEINIMKIGSTQLNKTLSSNIAYKKTLQYSLEKTLGSPYWLLEKGSLGVFKIKDKSLIGQPETPALSLPIELTINGTTIVFEETINYRINDPVRGEVITPFYTLPQLGINFEKEVNLYPNDSAQTIRLEVTNYGQRFEGEVELCFPNGWTIDQAKKKVSLNERGASAFVSYQLSPTAKAESGLMGPLVHVNGKTMDKSFSVKEINYEHIPKQYVSQPSEAKLVRLDLTLPNKKVGYIMGAGDLVQTNLQAIGFPVTSIDIESISQEELNQFDTILVGIRAFNVLESLKYKNQLLFDFAAQGGTLIVQYNTSRRMQTKEILPYPIELSRDRVTDENSRVRILEPKHAAFNSPHKISAKDFEGWVQERGLYFANNWDPKITPLLGMNDEGESEKLGSLLVAPHGNGTVVYTGLSFFRELPAGVPGAYRLLLNLIAL